MNQTKQMIRCGAEYGLDVTSCDVGVAALDTGIFLHEDFEGRVVVFRDMLQQWNEPYDDDEHGAHISTIIGGAGIASEGRYYGVTPGCSLISIKVLDKKGSGYAFGVLAGIRWMWENKGRCEIRIVNIFVGSHSKKDMNENSALVKEVNAAWDDGLVVVMAVRSQGSDRMTITTPGISHGVITVGCSDDHEKVDAMGNRVVDYSGREPTGACIYKSNVVAPGSSIISCANTPGRYMIKSGTSISTPLMSGAIVLLLEKYPDMSSRDVKLRFWGRCVDLGLPRNQQGQGDLDVCRLLE